MMSPLISILIPAYQAEKTISRCLKSVLGQTSTNYEVIVVDDGSTDSTLSICQTFMDGKRFRVYSQQNMGVAATRQRLLELAQGEYIQFVDADDWVEPNMMETLCGLLQQETLVDLVILDYILHTNSRVVYKIQKPSSLTTAGLVRDISSPRMLGVLWNKLIRKEIFLGLKVPNVKYCEDWCVCVSLFQNAKEIKYCNEAFYHYDNVITENSLTRNINKETFKSRIQYIEYLHSIGLNNSYPKEYDSQVANIAYAALVHGIFSNEEFFQRFGHVSFLCNYNTTYKKLILLLTLFLPLSVVRKIDLNIRKLLGR